MDLIYANEEHEDVGVIQEYSFDLAFGADENDFELTVSSDNNICYENYLIYIDGTEYGGIVDSIFTDTNLKIIKYMGRTFHGILEKKVICPDIGQAYYIESGKVNQIIARVIQRVGLDDFFDASDDDSPTISNYKFGRYIDAYSGLKNMLASIGYKLKIKYENGRVLLSSKSINIYDNEIDSDVVQLKIQQTFNPINHLICLGKGELEERTRIDLYSDEEGNISEIQTFFGLDEITETYEYTAAESVEELQKEGMKKLKEMNTNSIEMNLGESVSFDIGDQITASDITTGLTVTKSIIKKIVTIEQGITKINYKVGE